MLKNQLESEPNNGSVNVHGSSHDGRVTPEELSAAIRAIEERKAQERKRIAETVGVAEIVRELGIDASPEEILREVEAQRLKQASEPMLEAAGLNKKFYDKPFAGTSIKKMAAAAVFSITVIVFTAAPAIWSARMADRAKILSPPISETLAQVPDNHPVTCDTANLEKLVETHGKGQIVVTDGLNPLNSPWTLVKENGGVYVLGYMQSKMTQAALDAGPVTLYNARRDADTVMGQPTEVSLNTGQMHWIGSSGSGLNLTATVDQVKLDAETYKAWK